MLREVALREITGRNNFSLQKTFEQAGIVLSPEEKREIMQEAILSLVDSKMIFYIRSKYQAYKNQYPE